MEQQLAAVTVHPLPPPTGPPRPPDCPEGPQCVGWFAKLRGSPAEREAAAAAAIETTTAAAAPQQQQSGRQPAPRAVENPTYTFVFNATSTLSPLRPPPCPTDLNEGYPDGYVSPAGYRVGVEEVVLAALEAGVDLFAADGEGDGTTPRPLLVTYRNNLNKVIGTAFNPGNEWAVDAVMLERPSPSRRPVVFLDIVQLPAAWEANSPDADRFTYWGYKFEALCSEAGAADSSHAWSSGDGRGGSAASTTPPPARHGRPEWAALLRRRLGPVDVLFAAETDGFCPDLATRVAPSSSGLAPVIAPNTPPVPLFATLEVKTLKWPTSAGAAAALHSRKVPTWWLQSWLAGCAEVWAGGRDPDGTLTRVDRIPVADLPRWSASQGGRWCPAAVIESGAKLLEWMVGVVGQVEPGQTVSFRYAPPPKQERDWRGGGRGGGGGRQRLPGVLTARVREGGDMARRVEAAVREGVLLF